MVERSVPIRKKIIKTVAAVIGVLLLGFSLFYIFSDKTEAPKIYTDSMRIYGIIAVFMTLFFLILYGYAKKTEMKKAEAYDGRVMVVAVVAIGLIMRMILSVAAPQCDIDTGLFKFWGTQIVEKGIPNVYAALGDNLDYPPLYLYVLGFLAGIAKIFKVTDTDVYTMLVKLPAILADCGICLFIYKKYCQKLSKNWLFFFLSVWMFNPVAIIDSACWGQVDSILALFLLMGCYYMEKKKFISASLVMALGVLFKPQAIILLPILFYALIKNKKFNPWWQAALTFTVTFFALGLPFYCKMGMAEVSVAGINMKLPWIFSRYLGTADHYSYATVNALNFWFAIGKNWVVDTEEFMGLTYYKWGMIAIVAISAIIWVLYLVAKDRPSLPYLMGATLLSVVVTFGPRMHERYFFPVVVLLAAAMIKDNDKALLGIYGATSFFGFLTVAEIMTDLLAGADASWRSYYWPEITNFRMVLAVGNIICCLALFVYTVIYTFKPKKLEKKCLKMFEENPEGQEEFVK